MTVIRLHRGLEEKFDLFCSATTFENILTSFNELCDGIVSMPTKQSWNIFHELSINLKSYWKAAALFSKLEKRVKMKQYHHQTLCRDVNVLVIGCGPCGMRCAIELALLGARVIIIEKRHTFSRNNVLHLWPYLIEDLKALGAKTFFGKFCAGSIDHISIRTLQCILLKVALLFGVQVFRGVTYTSLIEPSASKDLPIFFHDTKVNVPSSLFTKSFSIPNQNGFPSHHDEKKYINTDHMTGSTNAVGNRFNGKRHHRHYSPQQHKDTDYTNGGDKENKEYWYEKVKRFGWRAKLKPELLVLKNFHFDVLIAADGKRSCLGFPCKELRCRLAIAITVNFINYHTPAEAQVEEISGVARIFNQSFFSRLATDTGIDLENIVYYKDETHYFVMTAKKHSLLAKGVLKQDQDDSVSLLNKNNVDKKALQAYARETASYVTSGALTRLDFALNSYGEPDVDIFDFTRMFAAEHSCNILEKNRCLLLQCLIGDGLYEPFWPTGSGCALGFMSALDAAWSVSLLASGVHPLKVIAQRESVYQHLSQTTAQNMPPNFHDYTLNPLTRYQRCDLNLISPKQVQHLYIRDLTVHEDVLSSKNGIDSPTATMATIQSSILKYWIKPEHYEQKHFYLNPVENTLIRWFQIRLSSYLSCGLIDPINDLSASNWISGRNLLCLIHRYRPELLPDLYDLLEIDNVNHNDVNNRRRRRSDDQTNNSRLVHACRLMSEHFSVYFNSKSDSYTIIHPIHQHYHTVGYNQKKSVACPKSNTDWIIYLYNIYHVFSQLELPAFSVATSTAAHVMTKSSSVIDVHKSRLPNYSSSSDQFILRKTSASSISHSQRNNNVVDSKLVNGQTLTTPFFNHAIRSKSHRDNLNVIVERGLTTKRREELVAILNGRSTPVAKYSPSLLNINYTESDERDKKLLNDINVHLQKEEQQQQRRPVQLESLPKSSSSQIRIPENVARLFSPRKGSSYCYICQKRLYQLERVRVSSYYLHKDCLRCSTCDTLLSKDTVKCVNSKKSNEKALFYCYLHMPLENGRGECTVNSVEPRNHKSEASLKARLQAGVFPFGPTSTKDANLNGSTPLTLNGLNTSASCTALYTTTDLQINRQNDALNRKNLEIPCGKSAILAGHVDDDSDQIMGIVSISKPLNIIRSHPLSDSKSSSTNENNGNIRPRTKRKTINKTSECHSSGDYVGDRKPLMHKSVGIRDEPTPGPDCYLTGHLGLPEVVRRANMDLNTCTIWPESTISHAVEHMKSNRMNLLGTDEYFASSESECSFPYEHKICSSESGTYDTNRKRNHGNTDIWVINPNESSTSPAALSPENSKNFKFTVHSNSQKPIEASMSDPSLCTDSSNNIQSKIPPPFSSPSHQSRLAAKQRFCLEPPKPLTIDPLRFIGSRNQERTLICALDDCSETVEPMKSPLISTANIWPIAELTSVDLPSKVLYEEPLSQSSYKVITDHENSTYESDSGDWLSNDACKYTEMKGVPLATPEEIKDVDSSSIHNEPHFYETITPKHLNRSSSLHRSPVSDHQFMAITKKKKSSVRISSWNSDASISNPPSLIQTSMSSPIIRSTENLSWAKIKQITVKEEFETTHISKVPIAAKFYGKQNQQVCSEVDDRCERECFVDPELLAKRFSTWGPFENDNQDASSSTSSADLASQPVILPKQNSIQQFNMRRCNTNIINIQKDYSDPNFTTTKRTNFIQSHSSRDYRSLDRMDSNPVKIVYQTQQTENTIYPRVISTVTGNPTLLKTPLKQPNERHPNIPRRRSTVSPDNEGVYVFRIGREQETDNAFSIKPVVNQKSTNLNNQKKHISEKKFIMGSDSSGYERVSV
ncbi:[F-actin]-monooxygenase MICAL2 [Schistosoma japonicum]|uniref:[F-actin]-monooxygenase MICAL2 n=2 Tax=Schistosoma japonicum TaxID=6182 RepID=A0A4Z2CYJ9_SCHJA|nr:[F-actin]-monooxygenase MICAL2 [Schistosoma japonicum]